MAETIASNPTAPPAAAPAPRLMSIDALRGFDMFWIIGADSLVYALHKMSDNKATSFLAYELDHATWEGCHFYDLIFPLFVFIMGVSLVFSLTKHIQQGGRAEALKRIIWRSVLMFVVALIYSGGVTNRWPGIRVMGVLNRIALCYLFGAIIFLFCKPRVIVGIAVSLLVGYWAIMTFVPIRDIRMAHYKSDEFDKIALADNDVDKILRETGSTNATEIFYATTNWVKGKYDMGYNVANHVDFMYLGGRRYDTYWDPEGLLSTMPAIVTALLGIFAGLLLKNATVPDMRKVTILVGCGIGLVGVGFLWGQQFPVIKKIWSSSYVLVAGGYSAILLGAFYFVVDVLKFRFWCQPFVWMGMNSITVYLTSNLLGGGGFHKLAYRFAGGDVIHFFDAHFAKGAGELMVSVVGLILAFWFCQFLYRRKIFLRL